MVRVAAAKRHRSGIILCMLLLFSLAKGWLLHVGGSEAEVRQLQMRPLTINKVALQTDIQSEECKLGTAIDKYVSEHDSYPIAGDFGGGLCQICPTVHH